MVRVLCWNCCNRIGEPVPGRRHARLLARLREERPDLICLQEVDRPFMDYLVHQLPAYRFEGDSRTADPEDERVPIGVHRDLGAVSEAVTFWLSPAPERPSRGWDAHHPRCVTTLTVTTAEAALAIGNCHLDHRGRLARREGAAQLARWAEREHARGHRVILAGDFNARAGSATYRQLVGEGAPLTDSRVRCEALPEGARDTWRGAAGLLRGRIDHVLVDPGWRVLRHRTLGYEPGRRALSDHRALVVDLARGEDAAEGAA